jgi:hypothetical protein
MPMSPRLLRPRASGTAVHPDALNWVTRVTTNGGTVSSNTLAAVSTFCTSINAASGLRAAILRLNLFCGNSDASLNAVRTPLYLSGSLGGATIGNTTDTNFNFVAGDYQETGSGGGLKGNGTGKHLATGINLRTPPFTFASFNVTSGLHLSVSATEVETSGDRVLIGGNGQFGGTYYWMSGGVRGLRAGQFAGNATPTVAATSSPADEAHFLGQRTQTAATQLFREGQLNATGTDASTFADGANHQFFVFANCNNGPANFFSAARFRMYSIGYNLTAAQALAFSNAVIAFNTALGRA